MHHKWKEIIDIVFKNNQWKIVGDQLPTKSPDNCKGYLYCIAEEIDIVTAALAQHTFLNLKP